MNETLNTIFTRRSIRSYTGEAIDEETIKLLLKAGMYAPSAGNSQPWNFIVVHSKETMNKVMEIHPYSKMLKDADVLIVVCASQNGKMQKMFFPQDLGACIENILLAANSLGIGSVWLGVYPDDDRVCKLAQIFNTPNGIIPFGLISLGYPAEEKPDPDRFDESRIHKEKWA